MNWEKASFDWNQARAFLVSAEAGSFTAAARALRLTQSTVSRQVAALEKHLGVLLFERAGRTPGLTESGRALLDHFREMGAAALQVSLGASGRSQAVSGKVSITATDTVSAFLLPAALRRIAQELPGVEIELVVTDRLADLARREADIAVRHSRPEGAHLVARLLRETTGHLYAATACLERLGRPRSLEGLRNAAFVGFSPVADFHSALVARGIPIERERIKLATDSGAVMCELVRQGLGVGVLSRDIGDRLPGVERLQLDFEPITFPVWLTTHRELYTSRRIRRVFDILAEALS